MRIGVIGFEPTASCSQSRRSSQAELHPGNSSAAAERLLSDVISEKHITFITKIILHESHQFCNKILHQQVDWMRENQS